MARPSTDLRVLGGLALDVDGVARSLGGPKSQQLLSVLVAHAGDPVSSDRLVEALWPDQPPRSATATVQTRLSRLRSVLRPGFAIAHGPAGYRLDADGGEIDAARFEALLARSGALDARHRVPLLEAALDLWHGPAFGRFADLPDVYGEAIRLDELRLAATDQWAESKLATGDPAAMVGELEALVSRHPLRECYWRLLMVALYRCGRQAEALRRAAELRSTLREESGLDPSPALRQLEAQILADDPGLRLRTEEHIATGVRPSNTTGRQLLGATAFIGRDHDVGALAAALLEEPLVTVIGPGGVGKTRLATRVAGTVVGRFGDGVTVVELASQRDPAGTAQVIARALDIQPNRLQTIESTIQGHLSSAGALLLLDNCEHLVEVVAPLVDRLRSSCPNLRILATSREPLGLAGEYVHVLAPLEAPSSDASVAEKHQAAAVRLFAARAASAAPGFMLTDDNVDVVADICRRLDGLPLGLELATARLRTMGLGTLAVRLNQRTEMLGQTRRGADQRQRTLHNLVEWSYNLLTASERLVFEQLAVFAGGFDLVAAEAVCSMDATDASVLSHIASLVDKSMVVLTDPTRPRYRVLEPLREFGLDRLGERGQVEATESRHLDWFLDLARAGSAGLDGPDEPQWSDNLDREFDNFRAAHATAVRQGDARRALALVASLCEFATRRVQYEITAWAETSVALPDADGDPELPIAVGLCAYGRFVKGDMAAAVELARRALEIESDVDASQSGLPERVLGNALFYMERTDEALEWMSLMLTSAQRSGNKARVAHASYMRSVAATSIGDGIRGAILAGEARQAAAEAGSPTAQAQANYALGLTLESVDPSEALAHLERASALAALAGNRWVEAFSLTEVHWLQARRGDRLSALRGYAKVIDLWYRGGDWANQWLSLRRVLGILIDLGALQPATVLHGALGAVGASHAMPFEPTDAERLSQNIDHLRVRLEPAVFAEAVRLGASMTDSEIVSFVKQQVAELIGDSAGAELG